MFKVGEIVQHFLGPKSVAEALDMKGVKALEIAADMGVKIGYPKTVEEAIKMRDQCWEIAASRDGRTWPAHRIMPSVVGVSTLSHTPITPLVIGTYTSPCDQMMTYPQEGNRQAWNLFFDANHIPRPKE